MARRRRAAKDLGRSTSPSSAEYRDDCPLQRKSDGVIRHGVVVSPASRSSVSIADQSDIRWRSPRPIARPMRENIDPRQRDPDRSRPGQLAIRPIGMRMPRSREPHMHRMRRGERIIPRRPEIGTPCRWPE